MKDHSYQIFLVNHKQQEVLIYGPTPKLMAARNVALKQNPKRKIKIYRNQVLLPGGRNALDQAAYEEWFLRKENEPSSETNFLKGSTP